MQSSGANILLWRSLSAAVLVVVFAAVLDALGSDAPLMAAAHAIGLGVVTGLVGGTLAGLLMVGLAALPAPARLLWGGVGLAGGAWLTDQLGGFDKLAGAYSTWAWIAVLVPLIGGTLAGLVIALVQPARGLEAPIARRPGLARVMLVGLPLCALGLSVVDRTILPGLYPSAHLALRVAALTALWLAVMAWPIGIPNAARTGGVVVALAAALITPLSLESPITLDALASRPYTSLALATVRGIADLDRDGYASILGDGDCAPFDPLVHPGAEDVPENGLDENCTGGDASTTRHVSMDEVPIPSAPSPVDVVLVTIDTVRPDRTSLYGAERDTTPGLKRWAKGAVRFDHAFTTGALTTIALPSMMRGVYARRLRWRPVLFITGERMVAPPVPPGEHAINIYGAPLPEPHPPLARWLQRRGMTTAAVTEDGGAVMITPLYGSDEGFDTFEEIEPRGEHWRNGDDARVTARALARLDQLRQRDERFFLWVHYYSPHEPDFDYPGVTRWGDSVEDRYDHELAHVDGHVTRFLDAVDATGRPTVVLVASDHGEILTVAKRLHGVDVHEAALRVPLLLKGPGLAPGTTAVPASLVDVMPTLLAATRTPGPPSLDGADLFGLVKTPPARRVLHADTWKYDGRGRLTHNSSAAFDGTHKFELHINRRSYRVVDQRSLGLEVRNLMGQVDAAHLERAARAYLDATGLEPRLDGR